MAWQKLLAVQLDVTTPWPRLLALGVVLSSAAGTVMVVTLLVAPKRRAAHLPPLSVPGVSAGVVIGGGLLFAVMTELPVWAVLPIGIVLLAALRIALSVSSRRRTPGA